MPFPLTILISAFFLFQVQPIIARFILPWYGGTPSVRPTMVFSQVGLLAGYGYAGVFARSYESRKQILINAALLTTACFFRPSPQPRPQLREHWHPRLGALSVIVRTWVAKEYETGYQDRQQRR